MAKGSYFGKIAAFVLTLMLSVYFCYNGYKLLTEPVRTVRAVYMTVDDYIASEGYLVRDEILLEGESAGTPVACVDSGSKVSKNEVVALYYRDAGAAETSRRLEEIDRQIKDYEYVISESENKPDTTQMDKGITDAVADVCDSIENGVSAKTAESINEIKSLVLRRSLVYKDVSGIEEKLKTLYSEKDKLKNSLGGGVSYKTDSSGYYVSETDGYENVLSPSMLDQMTAAEYDALDEKASAVSENALGKIVSDFRWYFVTCLDASDAERLSEGSYYYLRFPQLMDREVRVRARMIGKPDENGRRIAVFTGTEICKELLSARNQSADIIIKRYEGVKVPKAALREVDGEWGVYCMSGQRAIFKKLEPCFETDSYFLVNSKGDKSGDIFVYDDIIVSGKGIENKQVVG